MRLHVLLLD
jgi:hypothetical protein